MAKNYTFKETVKVIAEGKDFETITDIGRRYPVLVHLITAVTAKAGDDFVRLVEFLPEHLTANKVNSAIKATITGAGTEEAEDADAAEAETKEEEKEKVKEDTVWNEKMTSKQLWEILGKAGKRKLAKSTKKADLIEACKQAFGSVEEPDEELDVAEEETPENPYEGKTAMELFKECKSRKIKVEPKKPAKFYMDLLLKDDAAKAQPEEPEEEDDDWGEEPEEEAPKKNTKTGKGAKPNKAAGAKKTKKEEPEESDDDEWDI